MGSIEPLIHDSSFVQEALGHLRCSLSGKVTLGRHSGLTFRHGRFFAVLQNWTHGTRPKPFVQWRTGGSELARGCGLVRSDLLWSRDARRSLYWGVVLLEPARRQTGL